MAGHVKGGFPPDWKRRARLKRDVNWEKAPWLGTHPNPAGIEKSNSSVFLQASQIFDSLQDDFVRQPEGISMNSWAVLPGAMRARLQTKFT